LPSYPTSSVEEKLTFSPSPATSSYILCASAKTINAYAASYIFYCVAQFGTNIMNDIIISDISSANWRGLAIGVSFFTFLIIPWVSAFIVDSVVHGVGW
jgi:hypothetical protein